MVSSQVSTSCVSFKRDASRISCKENRVQFVFMVSKSGGNKWKDSYFNVLNLRYLGPGVCVGLSLVG